MGNAQSSSEDRKQARVSKPRTFTSTRSSAVSSPLKSEFEGSISYSPSEDTESIPNTPTEPPTRDSISQQDLRQAIRTQLLAPGSSGFSKDDEDDRLGVMAATVARSLSRSGLRASHVPSAKSSLMQLHSESSQSSLGMERSVDLETAVALLHELRKTASPDDLVALRKYATNDISILITNII